MHLPAPALQFTSCLAQLLLPPPAGHMSGCFVRHEFGVGKDGSMLEIIDSQLPPLPARSPSRRCPVSLSLCTCVCWITTLNSTFLLFVYAFYNVHAFCRPVIGHPFSHRPVRSVHAFVQTASAHLPDTAPWHQCWNRASSLLQSGS